MKNMESIVTSNTLTINLDVRQLLDVDNACVKATHDATSFGELKTVAFCQKLRLKFMLIIVGEEEKV